MFVTLTQTADCLSDPDDQIDLPAGVDGKGSKRYYSVPLDLIGSSNEKILDWFHETVPIGCLEDFEWEVTPTNTHSNDPTSPPLFLPRMAIPTHISIELMIKRLRELPRFRYEIISSGIGELPERMSRPDGDNVAAEDVDDLIKRLEMLKNGTEHKSPA